MAVDYQKMTDDELLHIWVEVARGRGNHGGFLKSFAEAYIRADSGNRDAMDEAARILVEKYKLADYLDNFGKV